MLCWQMLYIIITVNVMPNGLMLFVIVFQGSGENRLPQSRRSDTCSWHFRAHVVIWFGLF